MFTLRFVTVYFWLAQIEVLSLQVYLGKEPNLNLGIPRRSPRPRGTSGSRRVTSGRRSFWRTWRHRCWRRACSTAHRNPERRGSTRTAAGTRSPAGPSKVLDRRSWLGSCFVLSDSSGQVWLKSNAEKNVPIRSINEKIRLEVFRLWWMKIILYVSTSR